MLSGLSSHLLCVAVIGVSARAPESCSRVPRGWATWVASGSCGSRAEASLWGGVAYAVRVASSPCDGSIGWGVPNQLPGRKFQSHPGVPPARLIGGMIGN